MLPLDVADLTADWFSTALDRDVTSVEVLDRSSGTTGRAQVALAGDPSVPPTVFVKLPPFDERQREFVTSVGMGVAEARFYRDLAPEIPVRIPEVWFADTDGDGYAMVLEDLVAGGCRFPHPKDDDIAWRARDIVENMAALHARFWESPALTRAAHSKWLAAGEQGGRGRRLRSYRWSTASAVRLPTSSTGWPTSTSPATTTSGPAEPPAPHVRPRRSAHGQPLRRHTRR